MFDVNLNQIERDALYDTSDDREEEAYEEVLSMVESYLLEIHNRGKRQGEAMFTDAVIKSIVYELKR